jgi:hypothetical protein
MKLFGKTLKLNLKKLTHSDRVAIARQDAQTALGLFNTAHDTLEKANTDLGNVIQEAVNQRDELQRQVENAMAEIKMNTAVQSKLKDFISK